MPRRRSLESVAENLTAIPDIPRAELTERWTTAYGRPPPKGLSRRLLEYAAAYHVQTRAYGASSPTLRGKLRRTIALNNGVAGESKSNAVTAKKPPPGTRLVREWHGKTHTVEVLEQGFLHDEQHYRSLSEVARAITGARWSGPRFFGL